MIDQDIKKLDELAKKLESSELPLEEALESFNEGIQLIRKCTKTIEAAELRVKEILEKADGSTEEKAL